ncbi:MAG TPA: shikimate kinase [Vicinamibacteria bacterium]|nr:shikimate kinase [Vicinamibacteria bacterium]
MADEPTRIVLVGFMGAGKTTVGERLARSLGWGFLDTDRRIEGDTGLPVAEIFRERGEAWFREQERRVAGAGAALRRHVIAAGGGAFAEPETRALLRAGAVTVWLRCDLDTILARVQGDAGRPRAGNRAIMQALLAQREPSYQLADVTVEAGGGTPDEVADRIRQAVFREGTPGVHRTTDR